MDIKKCQSLEEARGEIDKLDEQIVKLISARNSYIKQLAHFKNSVEEIKAEDRISDVIKPCSSNSDWRMGFYSFPKSLLNWQL